MNIEKLLNEQPHYDIMDFIKNSPEFIIYGKGNIGREVSQVLKKYGLNIKYFLDQKAIHNEKIESIPVYHPDHKDISEQEKKDCIVIIAIFNRDVDLKMIIQIILNKGFLKTITFMEFYQYFYSDLKDHFWLSPIKEYKNNIIKINNALSLFQEEKSSKLFIDIIHFRLTQDIKYSPQPQKTVQYFDKEIFNLDKTMKLIDCGAFDGDSLRELSGIIGKIDKIAAFEPDTKNFSKLAEMVKNIESGFANEVYLWPCGVWSKSEKLYFSEGQGEASGILANKAGANVISCVGIDEVLLGFKPNFIKMDIEGAEYQALLGAKNTILENTPNLAICIYHKPDDLWELPLLIHQWNPDYKLYLRPYAYSTFDLVLLAVK